jgi:BolA protein
VTDSRQALIHKVLDAQFNPSELLVKDQSHLHQGHAGARDGKGHFDVTIVADAFEGINRLHRHRMVYDALSKLIETDIHALRIKAFTPSERESNT